MFVNALRLDVQEADLVRLKREAKASKGFYVEPEAKLAFVIRIRGLNKIHPKVKTMSGMESGTCTCCMHPISTNSQCSCFADKENPSAAATPSDQ
jgi:hypothetical protein